MPDTQQRKNKNQSRHPSGSGRSGSRGSVRNAPSDHTRGERKKEALEENSGPVQHGEEDIV